MSVEPYAVIHGARNAVHVRRNGFAPTVLDIWIKPDELDGDGEFNLSLEDLGEALRALGFASSDLGFF